MIKEKFKSCMQAFCPSATNVAVAVSGGSDSVALTLLADEWAKNPGSNIVALTVDHRLRKESKEEANQVSKWLKARNIEHHILTNEEGNKPSSNAMEYARNIRYKLLTEWCKENAIDNLLVAHQAEDQAETFLLRLERGSGVDGLSAMQPETVNNGIRILRPLLSFNKNQLQKYLERQNQQWIEDPTNEKLEYKRNSLRKALSKLPEQKLLINRINNTAKTMSRARKALEFYTDQFISGNVDLFQEGYAIVNLRNINKIPEEIFLRAFRKILCCIGGRKKMPRFGELERFCNEIISQPDFKGCTLWGCKIAPYGSDKIIILRERVDIQKNANINSGNEYLWDNRYIISLHKESNITPLNIRTFSNVELSTWLKSLSESEQQRVKPSLPKDVNETIPFFTSVNSAKKVESIIAVPHIGYYTNNEIRGLLSCDFKPITPITNNSFGYCPEEKYTVT